MSSLAEADAAFFRNQPQESDPIPTSDALVTCTTYNQPAPVRWDGTDGQGHTYWACKFCGSTTHKGA